MCSLRFSRVHCRNPYNAHLCCIPILLQISATVYGCSNTRSNPEPPTRSTGVSSAQLLAHMHTLYTHLQQHTRACTRIFNNTRHAHASSTTHKRKHLSSKLINIIGDSLHRAVVPSVKFVTLYKSSSFCTAGKIFTPRPRSAYEPGA